VISVKKRKITYLESQTPSFLLTVHFHPATMTVKGRLLSSTATVKHFRTPKNSKSTRVTGSPYR